MSRPLMSRIARSLATWQRWHTSMLVNETVSIAAGFGSAGRSGAECESGVLDAVMTRLAPWLDTISAEGVSGAARPDDTRACA